MILNRRRVSHRWTPRWS